MSRLFSLTLFVGTALAVQASPITFPSGFVPFTSIDYVTAPLANGDRLVLGNSFLAAASIIDSIPFPTSASQVFTDASIQLAPGQFFSDVYVPTAADRAGAYFEFSGLLTDPLTGAPFPGGFIPSSRLFGLYAFRLAPGAAIPTPEPISFALLGIALLLVPFAIRRGPKSRKL